MYCTVITLANNICSSITLVLGVLRAHQVLLWYWCRYFVFLNSYFILKTLADICTSITLVLGVLQAHQVLLWRWCRYFVFCLFLFHPKKLQIFALALLWYLVCYRHIRYYCDTDAGILYSEYSFLILKTLANICTSITLVLGVLQAHQVLLWCWCRYFVFTRYRRIFTYCTQESLLIPPTASIRFWKCAKSTSLVPEC